MLRSIFFRSRPPLLREGGEYACLNYHHETTPRGPSKPEHPRPVYVPALARSAIWTVLPGQEGKTRAIVFDRERWGGRQVNARAALLIASVIDLPPRLRQ